MPVDDTKIDDTILALEKIYREKKLEVNEIRLVLEGLNDIKLVPKTTLDKDGKRITENVLPMDRSMSETMTEERRQEIYDKIISKSESILGEPS